MGNVSKITCRQLSMEKNTCEFNENFIRNYNEDRDKGYILEVDVKYPKYLHNLHSDFHPYQKE